MTLEQMRARLAAIVAQLDGFKGEDLADADVETINALSEEFDGLQAKIQAAEKMEEIKAKSTASTRKTAPQSPTAYEKVTVTPSREEANGGFKSMGEFLVAVKSSASGQVDKRFQNAYFEKNAEDGGFLVPIEMVDSITKKLQSDESLLSRTRQLTVAGNSLSLPIDETSPWSGGIQAYWLSEGAPLTESKSKLGQANWKLNKLGALVKITDELLEDTVALESYIRAMAPEAIVHKMNSAIIAGDGVGKPTGILNSAFKVQVAKEGAQTADTVVARNVIKMYSKMIPSARGQAVWFANPAVEEQLRLMKDDVGNFIYMAPGSQMNQTPYGLLMGRPVVFLLGSMPALGDEGDLIFADLSYYYSITKVGGLKQSVSAHLEWLRDIQSYKWTMRVDGGCPFKAPITTEFGNYTMSAIVTLEAR
jgi:HK97 family phage major capsid protein